MDVESNGSEAKVEVSIFLPDVVALRVLDVLRVTYLPGDKRGH